MEKSKPPESRLLHAELTEKVIGVFYQVYNDLGFGFLESVYENAMAISLEAEGLRVAKQTGINVWYRGRQVGFQNEKKSLRTRPESLSKNPSDPPNPI